MTTKTKRPAIIFLNPPYDKSSEQLRQSIQKFCKTNKLSVIKAVQAKGMYDTKSLHKLMHRIRSIKNRPVTVIIDKNLKIPSNIIQCIVFETLSASGAIEILTFEQVHDLELKFKYLEKAEQNFLHLAVSYFKDITDLIVKC